MGQVTGAFRRAGANADLPEDLSPSEESGESLTSTSGESDGELVEEEKMAQVDDFKENAGSEKGINLSPQWLRVKPNEHKPGSSPSSTGIRDQKCQPHQNSVNSNQKDCPTPVPDVRDHHWNEEERETGNKGHRKIEFPKHSHQHKKNSFIVTSEAQSTPPSGSSSHEAPSRGDRTGPSGRGLAYRPVMDSRPPAASSSYVPPDHDAAGKRRPPRQRQQAHSGCSTGRAKSPIKGFATGRGRPSAMQSETNGGLGMLRYSRGKLLDIYRKQRKSSSFDAAPEGFNRAPKNSQPNLIRPSPSVAPDSDGKALLQDKIHGGTTSSGPSPKLLGEAGEVRLGVKVTGGNNCQKIIEDHKKESAKFDAGVIPSPWRSIFPKGNDKTESLVGRTAVNEQRMVAPKKEMTLDQNSRKNVHQALDSTDPHHGDVAKMIFSGRAAGSCQSQVRVPASVLESTGRVPSRHHLHSREMGESSLSSRRIPMNPELGSDRSVLGQQNSPFDPNICDSGQLTLEEQLSQQLQSQRLHRRTSHSPLQQVHLNGSSVDLPQSSHHPQAVDHPDHLLEQLLNLQTQEQQSRLPFLQQRNPSPDLKQQARQHSGHLSSDPSLAPPFLYKPGSGESQRPDALSQRRHEYVLPQEQLQAESSHGVCGQLFGMAGSTGHSGRSVMGSAGQRQSYSSGFDRSDLLRRQLRELGGISQPFERSSLGSSGMNMELLPQLDGLGWQNHLDHLISLHMGQLPNQVSGDMNLAGDERPELDRKRPENSPVSWAGAGSDERSGQARNIIPESLNVHPLESPYEARDAAEPFYLHSSDRSPGLPPVPAFHGDPSAEELMNEGQTGRANGDGIVMFQSSSRAMEADQGLSSTVSETKNMLVAEGVRGSNIREAAEEEQMNLGLTEHANGDGMLPFRSIFRAMEADEGLSSTVNEREPSEIFSEGGSKSEEGKTAIKGGNMGLNSTEMGLENRPSEELVNDRLTCPGGSPVAASEEEAAVETTEESSGEKKEKKKKWRKGRKMDPRLLGFKVRGCRPGD